MLSLNLSIGHAVKANHYLVVSVHTSMYKYILVCTCMYWYIPLGIDTRCCQSSPTTQSRGPCVKCCVPSRNSNYSIIRPFHQSYLAGFLEEIKLLQKNQKLRSWSPSRFDTRMLKYLMRPSSIALFILFCRSGLTCAESNSGLRSMSMTFFSSSAVHLNPFCISIYQYIQVYTGTYVYVLVCPSTYWYILICTGVQKVVQGSMMYFLVPPP